MLRFVMPIASKWRDFRGIVSNQSKPWARGENQ
jgi:hypothetical protein